MTYKPKSKYASVCLRGIPQGPGYPTACIPDTISWDPDTQLKVGFSQGVSHIMHAALSPPTPHKHTPHLARGWLPPLSFLLHHNKTT